VWETQNKRLNHDLLHGVTAHIHAVNDVYCAYSGYNHDVDLTRTGADSIQADMIVENTATAVVFTVCR
jgi:hypothetical protein